jgi:uncharacterized membrane protein YoaK (UPF0700 family)
VSTIAAPTGALHYLLLLLTVVAGAVDAVSFLSLGHVFVVNMTGNSCSWASRPPASPRSR